MMYEQILNYIVLYLLLEIYEVQWQKAGTIVGMLARMFETYKKSIFLFLVMHPTFYFAIWFMIVTDYNIYALSLFGIKMIDIAMKIVLIKQVFIEKKVTHDLSVALLAPINSYMPYMGVVVYPPFIFLALA